MTKIIVSSSQLRAKLLELKEEEAYHILCVPSKHAVLIGDIEIMCECTAPAQYIVDSEHINRLIKILSLLHDQPITIAIDSANWLYIKEAII